MGGPPGQGGLPHKPPIEEGAKGPGEVTLTTKKRGSGPEKEKPTKTKSDAASGAGAPRIPKRAASSSGSARPRLRASHAAVPPIAASGLDDDEGQSSRGDDEGGETRRPRGASRSGRAPGIPGPRRARAGGAS